MSVECVICELWHDVNYGSYNDNDEFSCNVCLDIEPEKENYDVSRKVEK